MNASKTCNPFETIKRTADSQELLLQYHFQLESLIELILAQDLAVVPVSKLHGCLLIANDLIRKARELNEDLIVAPYGAMNIDEETKN